MTHHYMTGHWDFMMAFSEVPVLALETYQYFPKSLLNNV